MGTRGMTKHLRPVVAGALGLMIALGHFPSASAQAPTDPIEARASATGTVLHAGALTMGDTTVVDGEVAFSGATVDASADGLSTGKVNEVNRPYQPGLSDKHSYARGSGLEVGLGVTPEDDAQIIVAGKAEADAPPSSTDTQEVGPVDANPLAFASLAHGDASARWNESGLVPGICVLGDDISRGTGFVADARLLNAGDSDAPVWLVGVHDPEPARSVSQSLSRTRLVPNPDGTFGLMSQVRQTIAPVVILADEAGLTRTITIELLGEWVLTVVSTGKPGGSTVHYGPGDVDPQTSILRIIDSDNEVSDILSFQDIFGDEGFVLDLLPLLSIAIGENPRAIAEPGTEPDPDSSPELAANGTSAAAAVDVLRIKLLSDPALGEVADIRVGHMEVTSQVPEGGIEGCDIPVRKSADPDAIIVDGDPDTAVVQIDVINPYTCELTNVVLTDEIYQTDGDPNFQLTAANPTAASPEMPTGDLTEATVVWNLGTIAAESASTVTLDVKAAGNDGVLEDIATAEGVIGDCEPGVAVEGFDVTGLGISGVSLPVTIDIGRILAVTGAGAMGTAAAGVVLALGALGTSVLLRRRSV